jgi:hypothetical protein
VEVIRQHHDRIDRERVRTSRRPNRCTQRADVIDQSARPPIDERGREEIRSARDEIPPVSHHAARISRISLRSIRATGVARGREKTTG